MPKMTFVTHEDGNTLKNETGRSTTHPKCKSCDASWIEHWKFHTNKIPRQCCVNGCTNAAEVGAHVLLPKLRDEERRNLVYIAPMCGDHNKSSDLLISKPRVTLVYAEQKACADVRKELE